MIEIWNNVFIQFERYWNPKFGGAKELKEWESENIHLTLKEETKKEFTEKRKQKHLQLTLLKELPEKHVDTGMGFERLVRVLQNKNSNYDTDIFTGTIAETERITGKKYDNSDSKEAVAFRVIADHIRAISFTITDGQLPSNTGAGYVIRRILRRAVRYYYSYLDYKQPLLHQLLPIIAKQFENVFPELRKQADFIDKVIKEEEEGFLRTLGNGLIKLDLYIREKFKERNNKLREKGIIVLHEDKNIDEIVTNENTDVPAMEQINDGKFAFELNDTFGFPLDLTELIASEKRWSVDKAGFETENATTKKPFTGLFKNRHRRLDCSQ